MYFIRGGFVKQLGHYETLDKMPKLSVDLILYICDISSENLGLILRSADIFGVHTVYYHQGNNTVNNKQIAKVSRNSSIPVHFVNDAEALLSIKENGYSVVALEITDVSVPLKEMPLKEKNCLVIGNEKTGVPDSILDIADCSCHIEMIGNRISSLNVSIAASIALYDIAQHYLFEKRNSG